MAQLSRLAAGLLGLGRMRLEEALDAYAADLAERGLSLRTVASYRTEIARFLAFVADRGRLAPSHVTRNDVVSYLSLSGPRGVPVAPGTRNRKYIVLRGFFAFLRRAGVVSAVPTDEIPWHREPRRERPVLRRRDLERLVHAARSGRGAFVQARDAAIVTVLFHVGLRVGELVSIDVDQLDLPRGLLLRVRRKGGLEMPLPLNRPAQEALEAWLRVRLPRAGASGAVFLSRTGRRLSRRSVEARLAVLGRAAGFAFPIFPHLLRHSFATELLRTGSNLEVARRLLGHASVTTTSRYAHPDQTALRSAVDRLAERTPRSPGRGEPDP